MNPIRHTRLGAAALAVAAGMLLTAAAPGAEANIALDMEAAFAAVESAAAGASTRALDAETTAQQARAAVAAASALTAVLETQVIDAQAESEVHRGHVGAVAAKIYRASGNGSLLAQMLVEAEPETLLARLGTMERVSKVSAQLSGAARSAADTASSQREQAAVAQTEQERLAAVAEEASASARAEADAETLAVASAQRELDALYVRLAEAERTSVAEAKADRMERAVAEQSASQPHAGAAPLPGVPSLPAAPPAPAAPTPPPPPPPAPPAPTPGGGPIATPAQAQATARAAVSARGWGDDQFSCLVKLWNRESGWRVEARNPSSGAYGIPQAYPAEKMAAAGPDWRTSAATQVTWGLSYISSRYGTPCGAWDHSERTGWY